MWWWFSCQVVSNSCDPMDCSLPGSSVHGILQARIVEWVATSFSRGSSWLRNRTWVSCIAGRWFTDWAMGEAQSSIVNENEREGIWVCFQFSSVQSLSHVRLFATPWTAAHQASLSISNSRSPPKPMSIKSMMPSNHLILCHSLLFLPSIFPSIRVFSSESTLLIRWPKYWSFSFSISPSNEHQDWSPLGWTGWISLQSKGLSRVFSNTTVQKRQSLVLNFLYSPTLTSIHDYWKNHSPEHPFKFCFK